MYMSDYDSTVPSFRNLVPYVAGGYWWGTPTTDAFSTGTHWTVNLYPYMKNIELYHCPSATTSLLQQNINQPYANLYAVFWSEYGLNWDYLYHTYDGTNCYSPYYAAPSPNAASPITESEIGSPSGMVMMADTKIVDAGGGSYFFSNFIQSPAGITSPDACAFVGWGWGANSAWDASPNTTSTAQFAPRHTGGGNVAFMDGHCKWMTPGALTAGTNWHVGITDSDVQITDTAQYLWDRN
jgi:prepilin-type processing-associated H-X9-DG protein